MRKTIMGFIAAAAILSLAAPAAADSTEISVECHWYLGVECELECDELSFEAYCEPECESFEIDVECSASCEASCNTECEASPGSWECEGYCEGECGASCSGSCESNANTAECQGECSAWCEGECGVSCEGTPPSIECEGGCEASCEGNCTAEANIDCHFCDVDATIDCNANCDIDGILECNGEYIGDYSLEDAVDWVRENTNFEITYEAECSGNECHASGSCSIGCVVGSSPTAGPWLFSLLAGLAFLPFLRRRK